MDRRRLARTLPLASVQEDRLRRTPQAIALMQELLPLLLNLPSQRLSHHDHLAPAVLHG